MPQPACPRPPTGARGPQSGDQLSEAHRRALGVVLRNIEEGLDRFEVEVSLAEANRPHALYRVSSPYSRSQLAELRELSGSLRRQLERCRDRWRLEVRQRRLASEAAAAAAIWWADLEESRPHQMGRYGEVPPGLRPELADDVETLSALVRRWADACRPDHGPGGDPVNADG